MPALEPTTKASKWTSDRGRDRRLSVQDATDLRRDDHLPERGFEFIPLWGFLVFLPYGMRRVDCRDCGAVVEDPWSDGKPQWTRAYMLLLGAQALLEGNRRVLPHFLGQSVRRRGICGHLGLGASHPGIDPCPRRG